jgi:hypothetical protein
MSLGLRSWLVAITVLLLAEDFQYMLKIESAVFEQIQSEQMAGCADCEENEEGKKEREEEKKEEKREKDDDNKLAPDDLQSAGSLLATIKFHDVLAPLSAIAHDLESPPPEV